MIIRNETEKKLLFTNGNIYTCDPQYPRCQAMAVHNDRIFALGDTADIRGLLKDGYDEIDLQNKTVLPGFIDTHCHAMSFGMNLGAWVGVHDAETIEDIKERVKARVQHLKKGEWIKGRGWCRGVFHDRMPTRGDIDEVAPDNPVVLIDSTGHIAIVNSKVLEMAGVDRTTEFSGGGKIDRDPETGEPNGILREMALYNLAWMKGPHPSEEDLVEAARQICEKAASVGITSLSLIMIPFPSEDEGRMGYSPSELKPFVTLRRNNELSVRVRYMMQAYRNWNAGDHTFLDHLIGLGLSSGFGDDKLEIGGIKIIDDGSIMANTAAMREPYATEPDMMGVLHFDQEQLNAMILKANENDFQVETHAHGDRAVDITLNAFEHAMNANPGKSLRNILTHARILHDEQIERIKKLGLVVNGVPGVNGWLPTRLAVEAENVGPQRAQLLSRLRTLIDHGVTVAGGSDCHPCHPYGPLHFIYRAVNSGNFSYEDPLTLDEAISLWTTNAAYVSWAEEKKGSLSCGKLADFVILSDDIHRVKLADIDKIEVEKTFVGGEVVWERE